RFSRDWSSDVCSSDLRCQRVVDQGPWSGGISDVALTRAPPGVPVGTTGATAAPEITGAVAVGVRGWLDTGPPARERAHHDGLLRSEERRGGKEWSTCA